MNKKTLLTGLILGLLIGLGWFVWFCLQTDLRVIFCEVGQGDGVLVQLQNIQILIDGGPANGRMVDCLASHLPLWDRRVELVLVTHPDADHLGGLAEVLEKYRVDRVLYNGEESTSEIGQRFFSLARQSNLTPAKKGDLVRVGELELELVWPPESQVLGAESEEEGRNERSLVGWLRYGDFDLLLTGDAGIEVEPEFWVGEVEVLKVSHHGSKTGTSADLLRMVSPELAVISVGKNQFGHPAPEVLDRLSQAESRVLRTDRAGEVELVVSETDWRVLGDQSWFGL